MAQSGRVSCGYDFHCVPDINKCLERLCRAGYDFHCVPLVNPRYKREFLSGPAKDRPGALTRSDLVLTSSDWSSLIVAKISEWIRTDSPVDFIRQNSEKAFLQELQFASHLSVPAIMIPVHGPDCVNLARLIYHHILTGQNHQFWIRVPMVSPELAVDDLIENGNTGRVATTSQEKSKDTWTWWNTIRTLCDTPKKIGLSLEISAELPSSEVINRWLGEPIRSVIIPTELFKTNKAGFPVLSKPHQGLIRQFIKLDSQFIIKGNNRHKDKGLAAYQRYLEHLYQTQEPVDSIRSVAKGFEDTLQCPLQPVMDNLESSTYEVFEKDPFKYTQYKKAIYEALIDRVPEKQIDDTTVIVMVLGAGRGPLVTATLSASRDAGRNVKVYAVEKNPNAVVTLENLKVETWGEVVTVVSCDMRVWEAPVKADIIISELLGSFGDNELSPECLDGAQKFLKDDGISIPCEYTSFLAPLTSSKLWNETKTCRDPGKLPEANYETPYVVHLHNCNVLTESKPVFTFHHPNKGLTDNNRYEILHFIIDIDTVIHGFGGYFSAILYKNCTLSIVPESHSPGMFSWFPVYFPIRDPFYVRCGTELEVHFWRMNDGKNVWYEWCISAPEPHPVHNTKGRCYTIGL